MDMPFTMPPPTLTLPGLGLATVNPDSSVTLAGDFGTITISPETAPDLYNFMGENIFFQAGKIVAQPDSPRVKMSELEAKTRYWTEPVK